MEIKWLYVVYEKDMSLMRMGQNTMVWLWIVLRNSSRILKPEIYVNCFRVLNLNLTMLFTGGAFSKWLGTFQLGCCSHYWILLWLQEEILLHRSRKKHMHSTRMWCRLGVCLQEHEPCCLLHASQNYELNRLLSFIHWYG